MELDGVIRWVHLLAASVWIGGSLTVAAAVPALRAAGVDRDQLRALARRFGVVAWVAMAASVATGIVQIARLEPELGPALGIKLMLVGFAVSLAYAHQLFARNASPAMRGLMEGGSLVLALVILAAAVAV
jgi:uncharacterized membrane protein